MPSIYELSGELVEQVLGYLEQSTLYAVSQVSRQLYHLTTPFLYKDLDLLIQPGDGIPRIDRLLTNFVERPHLASLVKTLRVGLAPKEGVVAGQRFLGDIEKNRSLLEKARVLLSREPLVPKGEDFQEALIYGEYGAYAAVLLMFLPSLKRLDIFDHQNETLRPLHKLLEVVQGSEDDQVHSTFVGRIRSIEEVSFNCDDKLGNGHLQNADESKVWLVWKFHGIRRLEFRVPSSYRGRVQLHRPFGGFQTMQARLDPIPITKLVMRGPVLTHLREVLMATLHLKSLTCELGHDLSIESADSRGTWLQLGTWNECLGNVRDSLETLVIGVEFCESEQPFFKQPSELYIEDSLDLRAFTKLSTLEVPVPFISGDARFSIMAPIEPRLPLSLRHLTLRSDMSHAQFPYPFDTSILPTAPTHQDTQDEANWLQYTRMDVSYIASVSLSLVDQLRQLKSISVWMPPDPSWDWFESQLDDLATTCKNNGISANALYPMSMRWRSAAHWNLIRETSLFDPAYPGRDQYARLLRGEREGVPLGLAMQYHLGEFEKRHVRRSRR